MTASPSSGHGEKNAPLEPSKASTNKLTHDHRTPLPPPPPPFKILSVQNFRFHHGCRLNNILLPRGHPIPAPLGSTASVGFRSSTLYIIIFNPQASNPSFWAVRHHKGFLPPMFPLGNLAFDILYIFSCKGLSISTACHTCHRVSTIFAPSVQDTHNAHYQS